MKVGLKVILAALAMSGFASVAQATTTTLPDITLINQSDAYYGSAKAGVAVNDTYNFALNVGSSETTVQLNSTVKNVLTNATLSLYEGGILVGQQSFVNGKNFNDVLDIVANLSSGAYSLVVSGLGSGSGAYSGNISISPVPLPGAVLLFGSGLIGLGVAARRRKTGSAASAA